VTVEVKPWPQVNDDLRALPTDTLRWQALRYIVQLRNEPFLGRPLREHPLLGNLSDCRKIFLDEHHDADPRWRIIYRLLPNTENPDIAEVIIIGPRDKGVVYTDAAERLGR
jgi:hypothetical protein